MVFSRCFCLFAVLIAAVHNLPPPGIYDYQDKNFQEKKKTQNSKIRKETLPPPRSKCRYAKSPRRQVWKRSGPADVFRFEVCPTMIDDTLNSGREKNNPIKPNSFFFLPFARRDAKTSRGRLGFLGGGLKIAFFKNVGFFPKVFSSNSFPGYSSLSLRAKRSLANRSEEIFQPRGGRKLMTNPKFFPSTNSELLWSMHVSLTD